MQARAPVTRSKAHVGKCSTLAATVRVPAAGRPRRARPGRAPLSPLRAAGPDSLDTNMLVAGGAAIVAAVGSIFALGQQGGEGAASAGRASDAVKRDDAILVLGAKGATGRLIVQQVGRMAPYGGRGTRHTPPPPIVRRRPALGLWVGAMPLRIPAPPADLLCACAMRPLARPVSLTAESRPYLLSYARCFHAGAPSSAHDPPAPCAPPACPRQLLRSGRTVVAAVRSAQKAAGVFAEVGIKEGPEAAGPGTGGLVLAGGVDVTDESTLTARLFDGVGQVRGGCQGRRLEEACG
jgi:hypothetical protein